MHNSEATLTVDGKELAASRADCTLLLGRLRVDSVSPQMDWSCSSIPVGDLVDYTQLHGLVVSMPDCINAVYENSCFKPLFEMNNEFYSIRSLRVDFIKFMPEHNLLHLTFDFVGSHHETDTNISVRGDIKADCRPINGRELLGCHETFHVRFADRYLPLLGLPPIPVGATREQITDYFGMPNHVGGGVRESFGDIPEWILYLLPNCTLRFQFADSQVTHITVCAVQTDGTPWWDRLNF
jgi:hypothetical protein